ncbi:MAG: DUF3486 family protein [Robiginitomaculum sp.]|nr:DUF3486 family protein [Robiginitomaculum sp.]
MPAPKKVDLLPELLKDELDLRLKKAGFGDYRGLSEWLSEHGFEISKSALHDYGKTFKASVDKVRIASEQAAYLKKLFPDDDGAMTDAILRRYATELFNYS